MSGLALLCQYHSSDEEGADVETAGQAMHSAQSDCDTESARSINSSSGEDQQIPDPDWSLLPSPAIAAVPEPPQKRAHGDYAPPKAPAALATQVQSSSDDETWGKWGKRDACYLSEFAWALRTPRNPRHGRVQANWAGEPGSLVSLAL
ncbi:unnamed protein product [Effrenium voratum]|nr:unnamed protein product [Effrenium voratum]